MADDKKNTTGDTERTSILPESAAQLTEPTQVLPAHDAVGETEQMPHVAQRDGADAIAGTPIDPAAQPSESVQTADEAAVPAVGLGAVAAGKPSWGRRAAVAGGAAAMLFVGFGVGMITHAAVAGHGVSSYDQTHEHADRGEGPRWGSDADDGRRDQGQDASSQRGRAGRGPGTQGENGSREATRSGSGSGDTGADRTPRGPRGGQTSTDQPTQSGGRAS